MIEFSGRRNLYVVLIPLSSTERFFFLSPFGPERCCQFKCLLRITSKGFIVASNFHLTRSHSFPVAQLIKYSKYNAFVYPKASREAGERGETRTFFRLFSLSLSHADRSWMGLHVFGEREPRSFSSNYDP